MEYHAARMKVVGIDQEAAEIRRETEKVRLEIAQQELAALKKKETENGIQISHALFRKNRFMLDKKFQQKSSKFAIILEYEKPKWLFTLFTRAFIR